MAEPTLAAEVEVEEAEAVPQHADAEQAKASSALDALSARDMVEEQQLCAAALPTTSSAVARALAVEEERARVARARDRDLAAVKLANPGDVDLLAQQTDGDRRAAERTLREHGGDLAAALQHFVLT